MAEHILIIEDEEKLARMLELELTYEGYSVQKAFDGRDGLNKALERTADLILLDIMLPGLSGLEVLRRLKKEGVRTPVILLTARDNVADKVSGLDAGADDYVTKPFAIEELLARIRANLRKSAKFQEEEAPVVYRVEGVELRPDSREVLVNGQPVELTRREFDLLCCLMEHRGKVLSRSALLNMVWGYEYAGETNTVDVYIRFLRSKIDARLGRKLIETVRGVGYAIR
ncbi:MAG: response regulator transcription factor [Clostridiales bacterium]|nr:response regulator transcription factor [Clostridiales bacterium]